MCKAKCPSCEKVFKLKDAHAGKKIKCTQCGAVVPVPSLDAKPKSIRKIIMKRCLVYIFATLCFLGTASLSLAADPAKSLTERKDVKAFIDTMVKKHGLDRQQVTQGPPLVYYGLAAEVGVLGAHFNRPVLHGYVRLRYIRVGLLFFGIAGAPPRPEDRLPP